MEYLLVMWLCSTVPGNECRKIETEIKEFKDHYECSIYGYNTSVDIIKKIEKEFVNSYGIHTKFICPIQKPKQET